MPDSDEQLIGRWQNHRDQAALGRLADRYLGQFYSAARAMLFSATEAEDVAQEAMFKIVRSIDSINGRATFRTWSYTILMNTIRSEVRRQRRLSERVDAAADVTLATTNDAVDSLAARETRSCVESALASLTEKQRVAIVLMLMEGLTAAEVAEMESCSIDAVYQRVSEARKVLRNAPALKSVWFDET